MQKPSIFRRLRIPDLVLNASIFLLLFSIGIMGGRSLGKIKMFQGQQKDNYFDESDTGIGNRQRNLLIVGVDHLNSPEPTLDSVWLLISIPGIESLTLIPIYPTIEGGTTVADTSLAQIFALTGEKIPKNEFLDRLGQQIWWDNYLLFDQKGFASMVDTLIKVNDESIDLDISSILTPFPPAWQDPDSALNHQARLLEIVCLQASKLTQPTEIRNFIDLIKPKIHTDLDWEEASQRWSFERQDQFQFKCEFPTLTLGNP